MARKNKLYQCPYNPACKCDMREGCLGCEDFAPDNLVAKTASTNSAMDAIDALADKWCDSTNQQDSICVALYQFTQWARQQHQ